MESCLLFQGRDHRALSFPSRPRSRESAPENGRPK
jgi:hypothetical protein